VTTLVTACGGGSDAAGEATRSISATLSPDGELMLSEVATNHFSDDVGWFEIHNPSSVPLDLGAYTLRSSALDLSTRLSYPQPHSFELPSAVIPPGGHLVVAARVYSTLKPNAQMVYVRNGTLVPFWNAHGSLELVRGQTTVDFVRFGNSTAAPLNANGWRGANVPALPSGPAEHGKAIVRRAAGGMADSNGPNDWALVNFATPAGPNDVEPGVTDSDGDGIPDSAKLPGGTYAGIDLYAMGARAGRRSIFIEVDHMNGSDPALLPRREALEQVARAFARRDISVHIDTGALHAAQFDPAGFNLGGGNAVDFAPCIELVNSGAGARSGCTSFYDFKSAHFDVRRNLIFHYALFANSLRTDGAAGSSGVAELNGNDMVVSLGGYGFSTTPGASLNLLINLQASTFMHELGHNLGLRHGGNEDANYKPNHYSVMNYMYQFAGLSDTPDSMFAAERYYLTNGLKGKTYCNLVENSPCGPNFRIDFSDGGSIALDENNLREAQNIGRGAQPGAYADWDNNNVFTSQVVARNLNPQEGGARTVLRDYDEWSNLAIPFARGRAGNNFGEEGALHRPDSPFLPFPQTQQMEQDADDESEDHRARRSPRANPMNQRARERIVEAPLPLLMQQAVKEARAMHGGWKKRDD
jgi:hypothetical protein